MERDENWKGTILFLALFSFFFFFLAAKPSLYWYLAGGIGIME